MLQTFLVPNSVISSAEFRKKCSRFWKKWRNSLCRDCSQNANLSSWRKTKIRGLFPPKSYISECPYWIDLYVSPFSCHFGYVDLVKGNGFWYVENGTITPLFMNLFFWGKREIMWVSRGSHFWVILYRYARHFPIYKSESYSQMWKSLLTTDQELCCSAF